jgi:pimeloyl-ACP methyl ester carboxylesterase
MPKGVVRRAAGAGAADVEIEIAYETLGDPGAIPLLLIHGLGRQFVAWHPDLLKQLVARGYQVTIFDNRDAGQSTHFTAAGTPDIKRLLERDMSAAIYTLSDLADDAAGLLDLVGWQSAHVFGVSMGGMIAQTLAIRHPERVRSLTTIMATTGADEVGQASDAAMATLLSPPANSREEYIEQSVVSYGVLGSIGFPHDLEYVRSRSAQEWDRGHDSGASIRQVAAIVAGGDRTSALAELRIPTLVVHGDADPLVNVTGGRATAAAIRGAELLEVEGMGHDLPREVWPRLFDRLDDVVARGENPRKAA